MHITHNLQNYKVMHVCVSEPEFVICFSSNRKLIFIPQELCIRTIMKTLNFYNIVIRKSVYHHKFLISLQNSSLEAKSNKTTSLREIILCDDLLCPLSHLPMHTQRQENLINISQKIKSKFPPLTLSLFMLFKYNK